MSTDKAIKLLMRRAKLLHTRIQQHEVENHKVAFYDRAELAALRVALRQMGVPEEQLLQSPEKINWDEQTDPMV